jgi:signal transduction histidine kinase
VAAPGAARHLPARTAFLHALGFGAAEAPSDAGAPAAVLAEFAASETFRWVRRWALVAVVGLLTPITLITPFGNEMPASHRLAVPLAVAVMLPAWVVELSGVRWPRLALIAATVLPNAWLTLIGHVSTNYLWLLLLVGWVGFAGTRAEGLLALGLAFATMTAGVAFVVAPAIGAIPWEFWTEWSFSLLLTWFLALVLRRQVVLVAELRLLRGEAEQRARQVAVLEERQRLSRELHDSVTQALYGISLYAEAGSRALTEGDREPAAAHLQEIRDTTQEALGEMRLLLFELRPPLLQEHGLAAALRARLQAVETRAGLTTELECPGAERLPPDTEQELYRLAQEALNNVLKHAHAGRVRVRLAAAEGRVTLEVADDGVGFEPSLRSAGGLGLRGMRERAERLGGTLRIESAPGAGTRVRVEVPR